MGKNRLIEKTSVKPNEGKTHGLMREEKESS
jgi:hypothetical protein